MPAPSAKPIAPGASYNASAGAAIGQHAALKQGASEGLVIETSAADSICVGFVHTDSYASGEGVTVFVSGVVWAEAAGAVTLGVRLETGTAGRVQAAAATDKICGTAMSACSNAGELVAVLIQLSGQMSA